MERNPWHFAGMRDYLYSHSKVKLHLKPVVELLFSPV